MNLLAGPLAWLMRLLAWIALLAAVFFLLPLGVPHVEDALTYHSIRELLRIDRQWQDAVRALVPTNVAGHDIARWILVAGALILNRAFSRVAQAFRARQLIRSVDPASLEQAANTSVSIHAGGVKSRTALLDILAETKKKLETMQRDLAFLSIDVVGSTEMKIGEEKTQIEIDFRAYMKFIDAEIEAQGAMAEAWTPDGVMICFPTTDAAVTTAQNVINGLPAFNKNVKKIRGNFRVRCGVNAGRVYYDRSIPMEEMSDHVIDAAGHMQKYALPNTVALAKPALAQLTKRDGFKPTGKEVDGYEVYQWGKQ